MNHSQGSYLRSIWSQNIEAGIDFNRERFEITKPFFGGSQVGVRASFPGSGGERGRGIYMFDIASGRHLWSHRDNDNFLWAAEPLVDDKSVYSAELRVLDALDLT